MNVIELFVLLIVIGLLVKYKLDKLTVKDKKKLNKWLSKFKKKLEVKQ
jgi:hypothetical protein